MADHQARSSSSADFYNILNVAKGSTIRDVCKAYKSLVMRWYPDKNSSQNKAISDGSDETINGKKQEDGSSGGSSHHSSGGSSHYYSRESRKGGSSRGRSSETPMRASKYPSVDDQFTTRSLLSKSSSRRSHTPTPSRTSSSLTKSMSQRSTTPIMYSFSRARRKPAPIEKQLECTLEELCHGCVKKIKITRDVVSDIGLIVQEEETLKIKVKPGWKRGTKVTFEGMGDEKPGSLPADIVFLIAEKHHPLFKRVEDDLLLTIEIPLLSALTGCTLSIPLLGGAKMSLQLKDIIYPGYEKIIPGQGMPDPRDQGRRGDLRVKFHINFPTQLSNQQRSEIRDLLGDS